MFASTTPGGDLFTADLLKEMCEVEEVMTNNSKIVDSRCQSHSIGSYIGLLHNKNCSQLNDDDITDTLQLLTKCAILYHKNVLSPLCFTHGCPTVPLECLHYGAVFTILHFLTDSGFMDSEKNNAKLTHAAVIVRLNEENQKQTFYHESILKVVASKDLKIVGLDARLKFDLFNVYLIWDLLYFMLAMGFIVVIVCIYLRSIVLTIATILDVVFSFAIAYFLYFVVFRFTFFPFLNLLSGLVIIALVADDVFLYYDTFQRMKMKYPSGNLSLWTTETMRHAGLSIFVTSLTTASAFLANVISDITAIKCFGIFSATAIICNFFLMMTWIPAIIILVEKYSKTCCKPTKSDSDKCSRRLSAGCGSISEAIFHRLIPCLVNHAYVLWIMLLFALGISGAVIIFVTPKLTLPTSEVIQTFTANDPMEVYDRELKLKFRFMQEAYQTGLMVQAVWGLDNVDNGNCLDPQSNGTLVFDHSFDLSSPESQTWILQFCRDLKEVPFIVEDYAKTDCSMAVFNEFMMLNCSKHFVQPCCGHATFPFSSEVFKQCFPLFVSQSQGQRLLGTPYLDNAGNGTKVYMINFRSNQVFNPSFSQMDKFYTQLESFMNKKLSTAPKGVKNGWFISNFEFYDVQRALSAGSYSAIGISLTVVLVVMLFTSRNIAITLYAIITIALAIFVTEGILVLLGWELNVLESIILSLAVGLSIDFVIHFGVAYQLSDQSTRKLCVHESFMTVGSPVAMAAFTTFLAGLAMMPARIHGYRQLGIFLMIVMSSSWLYATFFFQSMCRLAGPVNKCGQIDCCCSYCKKKSQTVDYEKKQMHRMEQDLFDSVLQRSIKRTSLRLSRGRETKLDQASYNEDEKSMSSQDILTNGNIPGHDDSAGLTNGETKWIKGKYPQLYTNCNLDSPESASLKSTEIFSSEHSQT